jgi:acyl-CoA thioesterase-1
VAYVRPVPMLVASICGLLVLSSVGAVELSSARGVDAAPAPAAHSALHMQLRRLNRSLREKHIVKILVIGSSSTVGIGASSPSRTYVARLEPDLKGAVTGVDFHVVGRGISGEEAQGAADRMRREVDAVGPDLVVWQVGTNDALDHVAMDRFRACLTKTLSWLQERNVDVVLINPQYGQTLVKDAYYEEVVNTIADVAQKAGVLLVDRYSAMRKVDLGKSNPDDLSADNLHMNDEGYRRLAAQLTAAIVGALTEGPVAAR